MKMKKNDGGGGGANWMDTYGDMVTLLLCFFVLLYSMSSIDENKWKALVQSFNPDAILVETSIPEGVSGPLAELPSSSALDAAQAELEAQQAEVDNAMEELYQALLQYIQDSGKNIELTKGDGVVYVNFDDTVFFEGEEYTILPEGEETLNVVCGVLDKAAPYIDELRVMGHTAQATLERPNNVRTDRFLSSNRATETTVYIQQHCTLDPGRIISEGYGQHRPIVPNDDANRAKNRRVEMTISGKDVLGQMGDSIQRYEDLRNGVTRGAASSSADSAASGSGASASGSATLSNAEGQERG